VALGGRTPDNGGTWKALYTADAETSDGWEQVEVDLTRFVGKVVRFRFNYQLFSFSASDRLGWMLDDVHVDMDTVAGTEVVVTNNLAQAAFTLTGPANRVIEGFGSDFRTNVPPGIYVVAWRPVPFYATPATRTNVLGDSTNALTFTGIYTFADVNKNGISDAWEQWFFGAVGAGHNGPGDRRGQGPADNASKPAGRPPKGPPGPPPGPPPRASRGSGPGRGRGGPDSRNGGPGNRRMTPRAGSGSPCRRRCRTARCGSVGKPRQAARTRWRRATTCSRGSGSATSPARPAVRCR